MQDTSKLETNIKEMIDELKGLCATNGLSNSSSEEEVITTVFLYKFLNDKFFFNLGKYADDTNKSINEILKSDEELEGFYQSYPQDVAFTYEETIQYLSNHTTRSDNKFYEEFDNALEHVSSNKRNIEFGIKTAGGEREPLFTRITEKVESSKRNNFAKSIFGIITKDKYNFSDAFNSNFDFYSAIFEYLIHDYNVASGKYAEYFTPQSVSSIIAKILVEMSPVEDTVYEVYDPSAGSGSLVLHLANELGKGSFGDKAMVYTQDISTKSTRFLRLNLLLNGLTGSLENVIEGDTLLNPSHFNEPGKETSGLKQFDYITSNPPFKVDFSSSRNNIENKWSNKNDKRDGLTRFFAGIPKVPEKNKDKMPIYLCFIQHILWSLKPKGKAAIVVPTGFLTAQSGIEMKIRQTIIDKHWLKGVISMPSNIFANTGTNVSVLFIDKSNEEGNVMLVDASNLGEKRKEGKNQRTVLRPNEITLIENTFINQEIVDDFSVAVTYDEIKEKNYSFSAGQYFVVKIDYVEISNDEFVRKISSSVDKLNDFFQKGEDLEKDIINNLGKITYGKN